MDNPNATICGIPVRIQTGWGMPKPKLVLRSVSHELLSLMKSKHGQSIDLSGVVSMNVISYSVHKIGSQRVDMTIVLQPNQTALKQYADHQQIRIEWNLESWRVPPRAKP